MVKSGWGAQFFVPEAQAVDQQYYQLSALLMYFRFPAEIGQEKPVSWYHGSSPGINYLYLSVAVVAVPSYSVPECCSSSSTTIENTSTGWCYPSYPQHVQLRAQVKMKAKLCDQFIDHHLEKITFSLKKQPLWVLVPTFWVDCFWFCSFIFFPTHKQQEEQAHIQESLILPAVGAIGLINQEKKPILCYGVFSIYYQCKEKNYQRRLFSTTTAGYQYQSRPYMAAKQQNLASINLS